LGKKKDLSLLQGKTRRNEKVAKKKGGGASSGGGSGQKNLSLEERAEKGGEIRTILPTTRENGENSVDYERGVRGTDGEIG